MMKPSIYVLRILYLALAIAIAGCSEEDDPSIDPEEVVDPPIPSLSFATSSDSTRISFDVVGDPEIMGTRYTFNLTDENNGCGMPGGDYVKLDTLESIWSNGFAIAAWVEFKDKARYYERIIDFGNGWGEHGGMNITLSRLARSTDLVLTSWIDSDSLTNREKGRLIARDAIVDGVTQLYAATISPSGEMKIFVNGMLVAEKANGHPVANVVRNQNYIGHSNWCEEDYDLKGTVDGVYIFNRVITPEEVSALYDLKSASAQTK
ncbi:LamG domain-containing protein [Fulvivirga sp. 29W222]|uniref:LamG domain-containing protein n=1 Tax=Fulvivirga marina TaxID=2494733 RepID=A0A937G0V9_9BACT|nr:LamG domain-containing protein [Fulvivirga marina]MBL6449755.1 LamG domain-containing protein [Fulvivirga marina]